LGNDVINGGVGDDLIYGDTKIEDSLGGDDKLRGGAGNDELHGNNGNDKLNGGSGDVVLFGDQGSDNISGGEGNDWAAGGVGNDKVLGQTGSDKMHGDDGKDYLNGGADNDTLAGGNGVDKIVGGTGSDTIKGGAGNDNLWGGNWSADNASDTFIFEGDTGKDYVHDFEAGLDIIDLSFFATTFDVVKDAVKDLGWATVIDLQYFDGGQAGDKIVLKSVSADDLGFDNFIF
jgi:serralysin